MKQTNLPALQAAVFDMDGTLLDSMQMWAEAPGMESTRPRALSGG